MATRAVTAVVIGDQVRMLGSTGVYRKVTGRSTSGKIVQLYLEGLAAPQSIPANGKVDVQGPVSK